MQLVYPVLTRRLVIRPLAPSDLARHYEIFSNPDVVRYLYEEPFDLQGAKEHLSRRCVTDLPAEGSWINFGVEVQDVGVLIGELGLGNVSVAHAHYEIGYVFDTAYCGNYYATEGAELVVEMAFSVLGAHRVSGRLDARNVPSSRVLERLGMRREALHVQNEFVKGEWTDELVFAVLESEWRAARGPARPFELRDQATT